VSSRPNPNLCPHEDGKRGVQGILTDVYKYDPADITVLLDTEKSKPQPTGANIKVSAIWLLDCIAVLQCNFLREFTSSITLTFIVTFASQLN
jgi:hypothetical protein